MSQIGIKLANHDFYPIIENIEDLPQEKEIELTTVRDGQPSVQINLFKKDENAESFIGSLVIEDLKNLNCGDATISLKLHLDEKRHLTAEATDKDTGGRQSFGISIDELNETAFLSDNFDSNKSDDSSLSFKNEASISQDADGAGDGSSDIDLSFADGEGGGASDVDLSFADGEGDGSSDVDLSFADGEGGGASDVDLSFADGEGGGASDVDLSFADGEGDGASDVDLSFADGEGDFDIKSADSGEESSAFDFDGENALSNKEPAFASEDSSFSKDDSEENIDGRVLPSLYEDEKKKAFPLWLKIFLAVLFACILSLVIALFLKNSFKESVITDGQDVGKAEILEQREEDLIEEPMDELTTEAPLPNAEPFAKKDDVAKQEENAPPLQEGENDKVLEKRVEEMPQVKTVVNDSIKKSVRYRLRWGDTLWDISETFYKNPWKYKKIARYNGIKNPNRIIAGRYITIPAK